MDHSGHIWITAFNEAAESIVGKTANELMELKEADEAQSAAVFQLALGKTYLFQCSAKQDSYNVSLSSYALASFPLADDPHMNNRTK